MESSVDPGDLTVDRRWVSVVGTFRSVLNDTIYIADEEGTVRTISIETVQHMDGEIGRSTGTRRWRIAYGLAGGVLAGRVLSRNAEPKNDSRLLTMGATTTKGIATILGGVVGTLVGGALSGEQWDTISLGAAQPRVTFIRDGRFAVNVNVRLR